MSLCSILSSQRAEKVINHALRRSDSACVCRTASRERRQLGSLPSLLRRGWFRGLEINILITYSLGGRYCAVIMMTPCHKRSGSRKKNNVLSSGVTFRVSFWVFGILQARLPTALQPSVSAGPRKRNWPWKRCHVSLLNWKKIGLALLARWNKCRSELNVVIQCNKVQSSMQVNIIKHNTTRIGLHIVSVTE